MCAGMRDTVKGPITMAQNVCAWLFPIACFSDNLRPGQTDTFSPISARLAESLLRQTMQQITRILQKVYQVWERGRSPQSLSTHTFTKSSSVV